MNPTFRRSWAEINLSALRRNLHTVGELAPEGSRVCAIVKADAYGHGLKPVAQALAESGIRRFGVANVAEALSLREILPEAEVLVLGPVYPDEREAVVTHRFIPGLSNEEEAATFSELARRIAPDHPLPVHLVVDTGMGRIGVWKSGAASLAAGIAALPGLSLEGVGTHLPVADEDEEWTLSQLARWRTVVEAVREATELPIPEVHALNSAGIIRFSRENDDLDTLTRPGLALYGSSPIPAFQAQLAPVLTWKTRISLLRDVPQGRAISYGRTYVTPSPMRVATLGVGYGDGYPRHVSGREAEVLIGGRRCAVLGRVTMDQIMVDVTKIPEVRVGDEVILLGQQDDETILAAELAEKAGTIPWEIFTSISRRVERVYTT